MSANSPGLAPEILQHELKKKEEAARQKRLQDVENKKTHLDKKWWIMPITGKDPKPILVVGRQIQEALDSRPGDIQIMSEDYATGWVKASEKGFEVTPIPQSKEEKYAPLERASDSELDWEAFPDDQLLEEAEKHSCAVVVDGAFNRKETVKALVRKGVTP